MKRFSGLLNRSKNSPNGTPSASVYSIDESGGSSGDTPEASAARAVRLFCESGSSSNGDEEVLQLPTIVDGAESSPAAAAACATQIRSFLHKQYMSKPHVQYNAIMLIRILSDHPGEPFMRNFDEKFVKSVKVVLRECPDPSTQQILRETLDSLDQKGAGNGGGAALVQMWRKERSEPVPVVPFDTRRDSGKSRMLGFGSKKNKSPSPAVMPGAHQAQASRPAPTRRPTLPPPSELASRVEEARNTAKILIQFLQTTPSEELTANDLVKEFNDRCQSAARSMQTYINSDNPQPDHDTMQTLIETNEQLSLASSRYQRAILAARRAHGSNASAIDAERAASNVSPLIYQPVPRHPQNSAPRSTQSPPSNGLGPSPLLDSERQTSIGGFGSNAVPAHYPVQQPRYNQAPMIPSPPISLLQDSQARTHTQNNLSVSSHAPSHNDLDDLYDSPDAPRAKPADNPFADPVEQTQAPLAIEPMNYSSAQRQHSSRQDLENAYASTPTASSAVNNQSITSPNSPPRPAIGPWHTSNVTPSFLGRQESAVNGLTMHAPGTPGATPAAIAEMDGGAIVADKDVSGSPGSPSRFRNRVDVAGTGGLRSA